MKIEKLEPSQHRQGRWLVWLEDGSLVRVGEGEVVSLGLYTGKELSEEEGEALAAITLGYPDETPRIPPRREGRWAIL